MGIVIEISAYGQWSCTYFVQCVDEDKAKRKAYDMAKDTFSCSLPDTLKEAEASDRISIKIITEVEQIIV